MGIGKSVARIIDPNLLRQPILTRGSMIKISDFGVAIFDFLFSDYRFSTPIWLHIRVYSLGPEECKITAHTL